VETIIGAVIALVGVGISQWWQAHREDTRAERVERRDREGRLFEHRRDAYMAFLEEFTRHRSINDDYHAGLLGPHQGSPPSDVEDFLVPVYQRLLPIQVYGTEDTYRSAVAAFEVLMRYVFGGERRAEASEVDLAFAAVLSNIGSEIGVEWSRAPGN